MKEKVLFISNPTALAGGPFPKLNFPLGIGYLMGEMRAAGEYDVECLDYQLPYVNDHSVIQKLQENSYVLVGIKGYAVDYLWAKQLVYLIREKIGDHVRIVVGGPLASYSYGVVLENLPVNYCITGEAETSLPLLLENLDSPEKVPGVAYMGADGKVVYTEGDGGWVTSKDIDDIAMPAYDLFDIPPYTVNRAPVPRSEKFYFKKFKTIDLLTGRGCPFSCTFCGRLTRNYRKRNVDLIVEEMKYLMKTYDINTFAIEDELFMQARPWIEEFCEKVAPLNVEWRCQSRVTGLKLDILKKMRRAGCLRITLGVEHGSEKILDRMHKQITRDDIRNAVHMCRKAGIFPGTELIIGMPGEDEETVQETIDLFDELRLPARQMAYLQLLPGTPLFNEFCGHGLNIIGDHLQVLEDLSRDDGTLTKFIHNVSGLPDDELVRLKNWAEQTMSDNYQRNFKRERPIRYYFDKTVAALGAFEGTNQLFYHKREDAIGGLVPSNIVNAQDHR